MLFVSSDNLKPGMVLAMDITIYNKYNFKTLLLSKGRVFDTSRIKKTLKSLERLYFFVKF